VRGDVDATKFDACAQKGMKLLADTSHQVPVVDMVLSADLKGALDDVVTKFWNDQGETPETFASQFADAMKTAQ
jgi:glucose/mannose transport system substrate-binding protein